MGRPRQQQKPETTPPEDPLADLRQEDDTPPVPPETPPVQGNGEDQPEEQEEDSGFRVMVTQEVWDEMVAEMVAAWHHDPTSLGFLHGGGSVCGCAYIARHALQAAVPVASEEELEEERELEPASD